MAWKSQARPSDLPNFESVARKLRYQLMGKACKEHGIKSLLLAHHQDDQAETILMRMIKGQRGPALAGIKSNNGIPECYGLHGIWESGGNPVTSPSSMHEGDSLPIETDGIRIYRPLLGFSKARLIATCETEHMSWFEDHTNKDPTLTTRNAIRHIYNTRQLPAALSKERLLRLAEKLVAATTCRNSLKQSYLSKCEVAGFSNRSGAITIKFPELRHADVILAAEILRHVIVLITPEEHVPISSLQGSVRHIFGHIEFGKHQISPKRFNVAGVFFEPLPGPSPSLERTWLICRQPYVSSVPKPTFNVSLSLNGDRVWTNWRLWDGRFWMRLQSSDRINIVVRPFSAGDVAKFRQSLSSAAKSKLKVHFKGIAKGGIRYTLPCLVVKKNGEDIVVGLPSIDIYSENTLVKCEIRYKKIDWDGLPVVTSQEELS
jgi:tRNA(Ile)-lysidine synthase